MKKQTNKAEPLVRAPLTNTYCHKLIHFPRNLYNSDTGDAENPIHNTLSKATSAIFSAYKRPTGVSLQP